MCDRRIRLVYSLYLFLLILYLSLPSPTPAPRIVCGDSTPMFWSVYPLPLSSESRSSSHTAQNTPLLQPGPWYCQGQTLCTSLQSTPHLHPASPLHKEPTGDRSAVKHHPARSSLLSYLYIFGSSF